MALSRLSEGLWGQGHPTHPLKPQTHGDDETTVRDMGKKDDDKDEKPVCGTCMGAGGEWIDQNGSSKKQSKWVACKSCNGTGRR